MKRRFMREEGGFTLTEMVITIVIWIIVLFALYNVFDMSIRVFSFGNNKVEAAASAREGLEKMEREIRQAYAFDRAGGNNQRFETWSSTAIRFGNDLDGSTKIECPNSANQCEKIGYQVYDAGGGNYALGRDNTSTGTTNTVANLKPVVDHVNYQSPTNTGLTFTYCTSGNSDPNDNCPAGFDVATNQASISMVRIQLSIKVHKGIKDATQTLSTDVDLRNPGS